jgi:hypothetical protein
VSTIDDTERAELKRALAVLVADGDVAAADAVRARLAGLPAPDAAKDEVVPRQSRKQASGRLRGAAGDREERGGVTDE